MTVLSVIKSWGTGFACFHLEENFKVMPDPDKLAVKAWAFNS
jgi:hypothetical protein